MTSPTGSDHRRIAVRGFTLLEMLVVLALIAVVSAGLLPRLVAGVRGPTLDGMAGRVVLAMRETQGLALSSGRTAVLHVDVGEHRLRVADGRGREIVIPGSWEMRLVTARREQTGADAGAVRFFPDGSSTGGRLVLRDGTDEVSVDVTWLTGRITVQAEEG